MSNRNNYRLSNAIKLALGAGLAAAMTFGQAVNAAEEDEAAELERVQVTGSRISRLDIEGATPVVTISREDLDSSGFQSIADFLRADSFNSFGSFRESSGNTWQGQATVSLRGLGSNRTLVLLNGRRLPGSPVMDGQRQNLNVIPFAAVERIEILSDGASAIYGSDAIGGVVNIILREDYEGGEATVRATDPSRPGGAERGISLVGGFAGDRGRVTWSIEADHQDIIGSADRFYTANQIIGDDLNLYSSYSNTSVFGRNILDQNTFEMRSMMVGNFGDEVCDAYGYGFEARIVEEDVYGLGGSLCTYDYTKIAAETAQLDRLSAFMTAEYDINSDLTFNTQVLAARNESFGRYAPTAGSFTWAGPNLAQETITYGGDSYTLAELNTGDYVYFRFNNAGDARATSQYDTQIDFSIGLDGFWNGVQWNTNYQFDQYSMSEWGNGYINILGLNAAADNGWDPRHPDQAQFSDAVPSMINNSNRRAAMEYQRLEVGAQFDGPMMGAGPVLFFVGGDYRDEKYFDETLAQMGAGNVLGTSGGSSSGTRWAWSVFGEADIPVVDTFSINTALRYDKYGDFGSSVSGKISARYQPADFIVVRGSFGTGFRAPSLDQLFQAPSQSFEYARDVASCAQNGVSYDDCAEPQHETYFNANPDLDAEESTQFLLGTVIDFSQLGLTSLTLSLDYYYTEIDQQIAWIGTEDAFWLELLDVIDDYDGVTVDRSSGAPVVNVLPVNLGSFDSTGVDLRVDWLTSLGNAGDLAVGFKLNKVLEYNSVDVIGGPNIDILGRYGFPDWRANFDIGWTYGSHSLTLSSFFIPSQAESDYLNPDVDLNDSSTFYFVKSDKSIDSYSHHSLMYAFEAPWNARISLGITNLTDEDPSLKSNLAYNRNLYPLMSRSYVASYTQRF